MTDLAKLVVALEAQNSQYLKKLEQSEKRVTRWESKTKKSVSNVKSLFLGLGAGLLLKRFAAGIIDATRQQEAAVAQLQQGLISTNNTVGKSIEQLKKEAADLQKVSVFGDEQIIQAQSQLLTFTNIAQDQFSRTIELAADLSTRMGTDLKSSVVQLGKALNDPIANLSALSRSGIQFSESQKSMIKQLVESNRLVDAQKIILKELDTQFGGSAKAARDTFGGAIQSLNNAFGDLLESKNVETTTASIEELTALLQDPATAEAADRLTSAIINGLSGAVSLLTEFANLGDQLGINLAAATGNLSEADRVAQELKDIDRALKGGLNTPIKYLFTSDEELLTLKEETTLLNRLVEKRSALAAQGDSRSGPQNAARKEEIKLLDQKIEQLKTISDLSSATATQTVGAQGSSSGGEVVSQLSADIKKTLDVFKQTLDLINSQARELTPENGYSELIRLTAEARQAAVAGDTEKALDLAKSGADVISFLKENGTETDSVLRGALAKLEQIVSKDLTGTDADKKPATVGVLEIKGLGKDVSITGNEQDIRDFVSQLTGALQAEAVAVSG